MSARSHGISCTSFLVYSPDLHIQVTIAFLDFAVLGQLVPCTRLNIRFLFVEPRFRYVFLSPPLTEVSFDSRYRVHRQQVPQGNCTPDVQHARRTKKGCIERYSLLFISDLFDKARDVILGIENDGTATGEVRGDIVRRSRHRILIGDISALIIHLNFRFFPVIDFRKADLGSFTEFDPVSLFIPDITPDSLACISIKDILLPNHCMTIKFEKLVLIIVTAEFSNLCLRNGTQKCVPNQCL